MTELIEERNGPMRDARLDGAEAAGYASLLRGESGRMLALISSGIGLHAFNQFAIVSAMPLAAAELGGRDWYSWVYSLYFIGSIAGGTAAASVRDRLGVRISLAIASLIFAFGGLIAFFAPAFGWIVFGRLLQGVADGLIVAICYSLIPANFASPLIARVFAVEATVWAVTALLGPLIGGLITETVSWRSSFLAVTPFLVTLALFTALAEPKTSGGRAASFAPVSVGLCADGTRLCAVFGKCAAALAGRVAGHRHSGTAVRRRARWPFRCATFPRRFVPLRLGTRPCLSHPVPDVGGAFGRQHLSGTFRQ